MELSNRLAESLSDFASEWTGALAYGAVAAVVGLGVFDGLVTGLPHLFI